MNLILDFLTNPCILLPLIASITAQLLKYLTRVIVDHDPSFKDFFRDGGMPSSHAATVVALVTSVGWKTGVGSVDFALAFILAVIVMRDAVGVRREAGKQAVTIKKLAEIVNAEQDGTEKKAVGAETLKEMVGHTGTQLFAGILWGILVASVGMLIIG